MTRGGRYREKQTQRCNHNKGNDKKRKIQRETDTKMQPQ